MKGLRDWFQEKETAEKERSCKVFRKTAEGKQVGRKGREERGTP